MLKERQISTGVKPNVKQKIFFENLDAIRFFAFSLVFLQHGFGNIFLKLNIENYFIQRITQFLFVNGGTGVSVFFVLSGFLITYLILTEINLQGRLDIKSFYIRRTLRIWPLYFLVVIFAFELYPFLKSLIGINSNLCSRSIYYYLFLANFDVINISRFCPGQDSMMEGITWSVAIEEQFYLIWPLFFIVVPKKYFALIFCFVILVSVLFRYYYLNDGAVLYFHTLSVCGDLAIGGLGAYLAINSKAFINFFRNLTPLFTFAIYFVGFTFCIFGFGFDFGIFTRLISSSFFLFIILEQNFRQGTSVKLSKLKLISKSGKYTYGYYLLHPIALLIVANFYRVFKISNADTLIQILNGLFAFLITLVISYLSYNYFESFFIRWKSKYAYFSK